MAKLSQLFDLQKFAENEELEDVINETHSRYSTSNIIELSDDELEFAAAGVNSRDDGAMTCEAMCPKCNKHTTFKLYSGGRAVCLTCGEKLVL